MWLQVQYSGCLSDEATFNNFLATIGSSISLGGSVIDCSNAHLQTASGAPLGQGLSFYNVCTNSVYGGTTNLTRQRSRENP